MRPVSPIIRPVMPIMHNVEPCGITGRRQLAPGLKTLADPRNALAPAAFERHRELSFNQIEKSLKDIQTEVQERRVAGTLTPKRLLELQQLHEGMARALDDLAPRAARAASPPPTVPSVRPASPPPSYEDAMRTR